METYSKMADSQLTNLDQRMQRAQEILDVRARSKVIRIFHCLYRNYVKNRCTRWKKRDEPPYNVLNRTVANCACAMTIFQGETKNAFETRTFEPNCAYNNACRHFAIDL